MNKSVLVVLTLLSVSSFATPLDLQIESILVDTPTWQNKVFCGFSKENSAVFACQMLGYNLAEVVDMGEFSPSDNCWMASPLGPSISLKLENGTSAYIKQIRCSRLKTPPISSDPKPIDPIPKP